MIYLEKYDHTKTYMTPASTLLTPAEVARQYPATQAFAHVVQTDSTGQMLFALMNLAALRDQYGIDSALSETQAIAAIEEKMNEPAPVPEPTAEERIAAAMEYQNLMSV